MILFPSETSLSVLAKHLESLGLYLKASGFVLQAVAKQIEEDTNE